MKVDLKVWWKLPTQVRFLLAGGYNTVFGYLSFAGLFLILHARLHYLVIAALCQIISVTSAFLVHRRLVFKSTEPWTTSFIRFNLSQQASFFIGMAGLYTLVNFGHLAPLVAQAALIPPSLVITYALHRYFSFKTRSPVAEREKVRLKS